MSEAFAYTLSLTGVSTVVIGCSTPAEVAENAALARQYTPLDSQALRGLEAKTRPFAPLTTAYKRPACIWDGRFLAGWGAGQGADATFLTSLVGTKFIAGAAVQVC